MSDDADKAAAAAEDAAWGEFRARTSEPDAYQFQSVFDGMTERELDEHIGAVMRPGMSDADIMLAVADRVVGRLPGTMEEVNAEIAKLEARMGTREWYNDSKSQLRLRALYRRRG